MNVELDHIFVFAKDDIRGSADPLLNALNFQASRRHEGQGTRNVCAIFESSYLEVIWICDEAEAEGNELALLERSRWRENDSCPFGIALRGSISNDGRRILRYSPEYLPEGSAIEIYSQTAETKYPLVFALPFVSESLAKRSSISPLGGAKIGGIDIIGVCIKYPAGRINPCIDLMSLLSDHKVDLRPTDSWHAELTMSTEDKAMHGIEISSNSLPLSLRLQYVRT